MNILMVNHVTGEVVGYHGEGKWSEGIKAIRGVVREWMNNGLSFSNFELLEWSTIEVFRHVKKYALEHSLVTCDLCDNRVRNMDMEIVEDHEGVCILAYCNHCAAEMQRDEVDLLAPTPEDIYEWENY